MGILKTMKSWMTRGTLADPDPDDVWAFTGGKSNAGTIVNTQTVLTYSPIWRGVTLIANAVAGLPIDIFVRDAGGLQKDKRHPAYKLLRRRPNREMSNVAFITALVARAILRGNSYAFIFRRGNGDPEELMLLDPSVTYPVRVNGRVEYVTQINNRLHRLELDDVIHIKGLSEDGLVGLSLVRHAKNALGLSMALEEHGSKFFSNNAVPKVVIEHPRHFSDAKTRNEFRDQWERAHKGIDNAHKTAVLENGIKVSPFSVNNKDSQFLEGRAFQIRDAANWLNLPPHKLGDTTRTAFASLEQENQAYLDDSINGWLIRFEAEFWSKLLTNEQQDQDTHTIEFNRNALVRADITARFAAYGVAIDKRILNPNEARAKENLNPYDGGDEYLIPLNMTTQSAIDANTNEPEPETNSIRQVEPEKNSGKLEHVEKIKTALRELLTATVQRLAKRVEAQAKRAAKKNPETVRDWIDELDVADDQVISVADSISIFHTGNRCDPDAVLKLCGERLRSWLVEGIGAKESEFEQLKTNSVDELSLELFSNLEC